MPSRFVLERGGSPGGTVALGLGGLMAKVRWAASLGTATGIFDLMMLVKRFLRGGREEGGVPTGRGGGRYMLRRERGWFVKVLRNDSGLKKELGDSEK
jgi:hypothetical protein